MSSCPDQHHSDRGAAAGGTQHGPGGLRGDRGRQEVHLHEGIHQLPLLQWGERVPLKPGSTSAILLLFSGSMWVFKRPKYVLRSGAVQLGGWWVYVGCLLFKLSGTLLHKASLWTGLMYLCTTLGWVMAGIWNRFSLCGRDTVNRHSEATLDVKQTQQT